MESGQYFYPFSSGEALIWSVCSFILFFRAEIIQIPDGSIFIISQDENEDARNFGESSDDDDPDQDFNFREVTDTDEGFDEESDSWKKIRKKITDSRISLVISL